MKLTKAESIVVKQALRFFRDFVTHDTSDSYKDGLCGLSPSSTRYQIITSVLEKIRKECT